MIPWWFIFAAIKDPAAAMLRAMWSLFSLLLLCGYNLSVVLMFGYVCMVLPLTASVHCNLSLIMCVCTVYACKSFSLTSSTSFVNSIHLSAIFSSLKMIIFWNNDHEIDIKYLCQELIIRRSCDNCPQASLTSCKVLPKSEQVDSRATPENRLCVSLKSVEVPTTTCVNKGWGRINFNWYLF